MVKTWVSELVAATDPADVSVTVGDDAPDDEQGWVNAIMGLPAGYKPGDEFPAALQAQIDSAQEKNAAASDSSKKSVATKDWQNQPDPGTQAWIDFMQSEPNPHGWNWPDYLVALRQEAREGHESAKKELDLFRANGVAISGGSSTVNTATTQTAPRQQANSQRRKERKARRQADYLAKKAFKSENCSQGADVWTAPNGTKSLCNLPGLELTAAPHVIAAAKAKRYDRVMAAFNAQLPETLGNIDAFFERLRSEGKTGKIRRFQPPLDALKKWIVTDAPTFDQFFSTDYMLQYKVFYDNCRQDFINHFYTTPQQKEDDNLDGQFYRVCLDLFDALYLAMVIVDAEDDGLIAREVIAS